MQKFTLTLVLNPDRTRVLMCNHRKFNKLNYIGGKIDEGENPLEASYRELEEETGIKRTDLVDELFIFRREIVMLYGAGRKLYNVYPDFDMYISIGVLKEDITLKEEKNPLHWISIRDTDSLLNANGDGNCYTFLVEGLAVLEAMEEGDTDGT